MALAEKVGFWLALAAYVASSISYITALTFGREKLRGYGQWLAITGLGLHTVNLALRWNIAGHGPYMNTYEVLSSTVWFAVLFFLVFQRRFPNLANLGALVMPLTFIMMGFALMGTSEVKALPPTLNSAWLVVHVVFAKLTVASIMVAVAASMVFLKKENLAGQPDGFLARLPSPAILDDFSYRLNAFGFIMLTIMIVTGAIWANNSWGSYWSWDPTQIWSLVAWLVYGMYLHGRITFRWKGRVAAWCCIIAFVFSIVAFFVIPYFVKSIHNQYMIG